ncbi:MAG: 6,7-dimethyl-8-ribityllumazine synthase [FCB group bacterium]|nr:6,7-dimethyl-8-ribityllumazine synthase [FCB group bacterium]
MNEIQGHLNAAGTKIVVIVAKFNREITDALLHGAIDAFLHYGGVENNLTVVKVPGAFEIPGAAKRIIESLKPHAIVTLGAVIRGGTPHFDYVAGEVSRGVARLSLESEIPVIFGVLTTDTLQQARERAGSRASNKGWDAVEAALDTLSVYEQIKTGTSI